MLIYIQSTLLTQHIYIGSYKFGGFDKVQIDRVNNKMDVVLRQSQKKRHSSSHVAIELKKVTQVIGNYTDRAFLQQHSLYSNLFSSQAYTFTMPEAEQMNLWFGRESLQSNQLYQYSYFQRRDKKMLLFYLILRFLRNESDGGKSRMVVIENIERVNRSQLRAFLGNREYGGSDKVLKDMDKRVLFIYSKNLTSYKFNLSFLSIMQEKDQFIKCVIISDVNTFQASDKLTLEKYYKRLPKEMLVFAFRRDIYDYKVIQKSPINEFYAEQHGEDKYELNDKVTSVLRKKYQTFTHTVPAFIIPIQYLGLSTKNIEETYKSCLIRILPDGPGYLQFTFKGYPFTVQNFRRITL